MYKRQVLYSTVQLLWNTYQVFIILNNRYNVSSLVGNNYKWNADNYHSNALDLALRAINLIEIYQFCQRCLSIYISPSDNVRHQSNIHPGLCQNFTAEMILLWTNNNSHADNFLYSSICLNLMEKQIKDRSYKIKFLQKLKGSMNTANVTCIIDTVFILLYGDEDKIKNNWKT